MKLKYKIGAFTLGLALLSTTLAGCGKPKYKVNVHADEGCTVVGINEEGYKAAENVSFTVTIANPADKEINLVTVDDNELTPVNDVYTFTMPEKDAELNVTLKDIIKYVIVLSGALKVGIERSYDLKFGDAAIPTFSLTATSGAEHVNIDGDYFKITGVSVGAVTLQATYRGEVVATLSTNVVLPEHGELRNDPLTVEEAIAIANALPSSTSSDKKPTEIGYYIRGVVTEVVENDPSYTNATVMLGQFEGYRLNFLTGVDRDKIVKGAEVLMYAALLKFGSTLETNYIEGAGFVEVDNSKIRLVDLDNAVRHVQKAGEAPLTAALYPEALASTAEVTWEAKDATKVNYEGSGKTVTVKAVANEGEAKIVAKCGEAQAEVLFKIVEGEVHGEVKEDPINAEVAIAIAKTLEKSTKDEKIESETHYYIKDIVTEVVENDTQYANVTGWIGGFELYRVTWDKNDENRAKFVEGAEITVKVPIILFGSTPENNGGEVLAIDNSVIRLIKVDPASAIMAEGDEAKELKAKLYPAALAEGATVTWESKDEAVATVASDGKVTPVAGGSTSIVAKVGEYEGECKLLVLAEGKTIRRVAKEEITSEGEYFLVLADKDDAKVNRYTTGEMDGYYLGTSADVADRAIVKVIEDTTSDAVYRWTLTINGKKLTYSYGADEEGGDAHHNIGLTEGTEKVAKLKLNEDLSFSVQSLKEGETDKELFLGSPSYNTLSYNYTKPARCAKLYGILDKINPTAVALSKTSVEIGVGQQLTLTVSPTPDVAEFDESKVVWETSDATKVTVDKGVIKGIALGEATITATYKDLPAVTCAVTVANITKVTLKYSGSTTANMEGESNNAAMVGLDANVFTVTSEKNDASNHVGLNKDGTIRLYSKEGGNGTGLKIKKASGNIKSIQVKLASASPNKFTALEVKGSTVLAGEIADLEATYIVNGGEVTLKNVATANSQQIHIAEIIIIY